MVKDQDHLAGRYRGSAHNGCNLNYRIAPKHIRIPWIIHNLRGYDPRLILSAAKPHQGENIALRNYMERYISFTVVDIVFIDSNQFMLSTLDKLCRDLDEEKFYETRKYLQS